MTAEGTLAACEAAVGAGVTPPACQAAVVCCCKCCQPVHACVWVACICLYSVRRQGVCACVCVFVCVPIARGGGWEPVLPVHISQQFSTIPSTLGSLTSPQAAGLVTPPSTCIVTVH
jgi:hypothetical protein